MTERRLRLQGKVAIVTGAGSRGPVIGNGRATAVLFAREGAKVLVVDRISELAQQTQEMIRSEGGEASAFTADVTKAEDCKRMIETAIKQYSRLDILHNSVGISGAGTVVEVTEEQWDHIMSVNLKSIVLSSKFAIPQMVNSGGGAIINVSSIGALRPRADVAYTTSKGGVIALTQVMALNHGRDHIRVNCIVPGPMYTSNVYEGMTPEKRERRRLESPLEIEGTGWDIAFAAVYLASDEARYVTGAILPVEGGVLLTRKGS